MDSSAIRVEYCSAALLGFNLEARASVATATAIALVVDGARMPVLFLYQPGDSSPLSLWIAIDGRGCDDWYFLKQADVCWRVYQKFIFAG